MRNNIAQNERVVVAVTIGGVVALAKDVWNGLFSLYQFALTPPGLALLSLASVLLSGISLMVLVTRHK